MCAARSTHRLRDDVHRQLTVLLGPDGPLSVAPAPVVGHLTDDLVDEIAIEYLEVVPPSELEGRAAIITAGPPGSGKSTVLDDFASGYRRIDPDLIKTMLLQRLESAGLLGARLDHLLADGEPVHPGELAWWVHQASTDAADAVRAQCLRMGENFVMEGTLAWSPLTEIYLRELADAGYEQLTVVTVEVPAGVATEQAKRRWWSGRCSGDPMGGRFVSDAAIGAFFAGPLTPCGANARQLYREANDSSIPADLALYSRRSDGLDCSALLDPAGRLQPWPIAGRFDSTQTGALCLRCGRVLTDPTSIRRGVGRGCAVAG